MTRTDRSSGSVAGHKAVRSDEPQPGFEQGDEKNLLKTRIKDCMTLAKQNDHRGCWLYLKMAYVALNGHERPD